MRSDRHPGIRRVSVNAMRLRAAISLTALGLGSAAATEGCGSRSELLGCTTNAECVDTRDLCTHFACEQQRCVRVSQTTCNDNNACTTDSCNRKTGACAFAPLSVDLDGDGHATPLQGFEPGAPGACGDDCDDSDSSAYPGKKEVCDGVDNDCDGIVDNGATYAPASVGNELRISELDADYAEPDFLARGGAGALAAYSASRSGQLGTELRRLDAAGTPVSAPAALTGADAAGTNSAAVWTGDRWGIAWSDRRDGNFEIYFATLDAQGSKLAPGDERITVSDGFSLYPKLVWNGHEFDLVWQEEVGAATFALQGQRLGVDGSLLGPIASLAGGLTAQGPALAAGRKELGLSWIEGTPSQHAVRFQTIGFDFAPLTAPITITSGAIQGVAASVAFNRTGYVVAFTDPRAGKRGVYAAVASTDGSLVIPPVAIALPGSDARDIAMLPLGDRVEFVYGDDRDGNQGYELYARTMWADLGPIAPPTRVTQARGDSISPSIAFTRSGAVGVLFRDDRGTSPAVFATTLACKL